MPEPLPRRPDPPDLQASLEPLDALDPQAATEMPEKMEALEPKAPLGLMDPPAKEETMEVPEPRDPLATLDPRDPAATVRRHDWRPAIKKILNKIDENFENFENFFLLLNFLMAKGFIFFFCNILYRFSFFFLFG